LRLVEGMSARRQCAGISTEQYGKMSRRRCCFKLQAGLSAIRKGGGRMTGIVVVFPRLEDAKGIRNLLVRSGFLVHAVCTTGAQAIGALEDLNDGIVISGYKLADMMYLELRDCLPQGFTLLLLATRQHLAECDIGGSMACLPMPLKAHELIETVHMLIRQCERNRRKRRESPREKSTEEMELIAQAKAFLMEKRSMTEMQAHKYLQKCSMDSGRSIAESAQMVLKMYAKG